MASRVKRAWLMVLAAAVAVALLAGCGGSDDSSSAAADVSFSGNAYPNIDLASTRVARSKIDSLNVAELEEAWSVPIEGTGDDGSYASTPVIVNGVVYSQDLESNVQAIDLGSGEVLWSKKYESPSQGPNGLAVADGRVYGATASGAFALDQKTGKEVWLTSLNGNVGMAPGVDHGKVYVSTVPEASGTEGEAGAVGTLWAMDGRTGRKLWHFDTVPKNLWGNPNVNSGGGLWYPPSFDEQGFVYAGTGNPAPLPGAPGEPWGESRPGPNLYTNSLVKLDPQNGKLLWYHQETPHDVYDWDFQDPPILTKVRGRDVAIGAGKSGFVVAVDRKDGKVVWRKTVGVHNYHDRDNLYAMRGEYDKIRLGETYPGQLGGVYAPMAADDERVYVPLINQPTMVESGAEVSYESGGEAPSIGGGAGEVQAIDLQTGEQAWELALPSPVFGALTISNDLVFATTEKGTIFALNVNRGGEVWEATLPAGAKGGVIISGDTLVVGAGLPLREGGAPKLVAYRLGG